MDLYEYKERERGRYLSREIFVDSISVGEFDEVGLRHTRSAQRFTEVSSPLSQCSLFSRLLFQAEVFGVWRLSQRWSLCSPPPPQCRTARVCVVAACVCVSRSLAAPIHPASLCHYTLALSLASFSCSLPPPPPLSVCLCLGRLFCTEPRHACTRCWLWLGRGLLFVRSPSLSHPIERATLPSRSRSRSPSLAALSCTLHTTFVDLHTSLYYHHLGPARCHRPRPRPRPAAIIDGGAACILCQVVYNHQHP